MGVDSSLSAAIVSSHHPSSAFGDSLACVTMAGDSLSCTSPQILSFFVMTKTLGVLMRQRAAPQTLAGLSDHRRNAERGPHLLH